MWGKHPLKERYDVVIVGAGVHGLSTAYYLGKLGVRSVAVLDKGYIGGGASARSTAIIRANYLTPEGIPFFRESLRLYEGLSGELEYNLLRRVHVAVGVDSDAGGSDELPGLGTE